MLWAAALALGLAACGRSGQVASGGRAAGPGAAAESARAAGERAIPPGASAPRAAAEPAGVAPARRPGYRAWVLAGPAALRALADSLGTARLAGLLALNRIDLAHARDRDTLIVPSPAAAFDSLSPFPFRLADAESLPRLLLVSNRVQAWAAYERGARVRWGACCTGRRAKPTPPGLYHTNWRQRARHSTIDGSWYLEWYVNLESREGISFHLFELPGRPSSHSCIRLSLDDAKWIYGWCETWTLAPDRRHVVRPGTPVVVLDTYAFGRRRPWRALPQDSLACDVPADSIAAALRSARVDGANPRRGAPAPDRPDRPLAAPRRDG